MERPEIPEPIDMNGDLGYVEQDTRVMWYALAQISDQLHHISTQLEEIAQQGRRADPRTYV